MSLSRRGQQNANQFSIPWRFAFPPTYNPHTNPTGLISFATAENVLVQPELHAFVTGLAIPKEALRYASSHGGGARLAAAFAAHINEYFNPCWKVEGADVKTTAGATGTHDVLAYSLCGEGEAVLTSRPYYGRFEIDFGSKAGVNLVAAETDHESCFQVGVVSALEMKLEESRREGVEIRAVLIINPHNPLGRCYPRETLIELMRFCQKHRLHLISDEIYALSVFDNPDAVNAAPFTSVLSIDPTSIIDPDLVHVIYGLSKDFGAAGLKVGCLISRNKNLKSAAQAVQRFSGLSGLSDAVATAILEDRVWCREFIALSRKRLADAYGFVTSRLRDIGVELFEGANAAFFVWMNLNPWSPPEGVSNGEETREQMLAQKFVSHGVFLQPGEEHGREGWFRLVFSLDRDLVEEGLRRIETTLKEVNW